MGSKEEAFESIRNESAIIWTGAGFSLYAGYPNAKDLGKLITKKISRKNRQYFKNGMPLDEICDVYLKLMSDKKEELYSILREIFNKSPTSIEHHKKLASIPHIKTIVTTNYDKLFESAYGNVLKVISGKEDLALVQNKNVTLFKIHGDLDHLEDIIISKSDYAEFYNKRINDPYWTIIKERIISNNVIFIGYSAEDINIKTILDWLPAEIADRKNKFFLVAPDYPPHEKAHLLKKNIFYIDSTGEKFINDLLENIKSNIRRDWDAKKVGLETFNQFLSYYDLSADFILDSNNRNHIPRFKPIGENARNGEIKFTLSNSETASLFEKYLKGHSSLESFELEEQHLKDFEIIVNGITIYDNTHLGKFIIVRKPTVDEKVDIAFHNGFDCRGVDVSIFSSNQMIRFKIKINKLLLEIKIAKDEREVSFAFFPSVDQSNSRDEIESYQVLKYFLEGEKFDVFLKDKRKYTSNVNYSGELINVVDKYLQYFKKIEKIEKHFGIRFNTLFNVSDEDFNIISHVEALIDSKLVHEYTFKDVFKIKMQEISADFFPILKKLNDRQDDDMCIEYKDGTINLYGYIFAIPLRIVRIHNACALNLNDFQKGINNELHVISKIGRISEHYSPLVYLPTTT